MSQSVDRSMGGVDPSEKLLFFLRRQGHRMANRCRCGLGDVSGRGKGVDYRHLLPALKRKPGAVVRSVLGAPNEPRSGLAATDLHPSRAAVMGERWHGRRFQLRFAGRSLPASVTDRQLAPIFHFRPIDWLKHIVAAALLLHAPLFKKSLFVANCIQALGSPTRFAHGQCQSFFSLPYHASHRRAFSQSAALITPSIARRLRHHIYPSHQWLTVA